MRPTTRINHQIKAREVRVLDDEQGNLGVMTLSEALGKAEAKGQDLIEISPGAVPPVVKIMDFGKFQYLENKKQKKSRAKGSASELKTLQVKIQTGEHDLELKARKASQFLKEGHRVKIDLFLAGRAKYMEFNFLRERIDRVLHLISESYKITDGPKKGPKGLTVILEKGTAAKNDVNQDQQIL